MQRSEPGILAIWHDLAPGHESRMLDWYDREHHLERVTVPGFHSARRYEALDTTTEQLFIRYEVDSPDVLSGAEYLHRVNNPSVWSLECQPLIRNNSRTACQRMAMFGFVGGYVAVVRFVTGMPDLDDARLQRAAAEASGICGVEVWTADLAATTIQTDEKRLRGQSDHTIVAAVVIHATRQNGLRALTAAWQQDPPWSGAENPMPAHYTLSFELAKSFLIER